MVLSIMIGYIYKITCLLNNRCYVGSKLSKIFVESYWSSSKNDDFWNDLKQYGKANFKREILRWCKTREELREKEEEYILSEKCLTLDGGYNQAYRAGTILFTPDICKKISNSLKNSWKRKSIEEKQKFAEKKRQQALDPNGKMQSKEYKDNMRKICTGRKVYNNGKVDIAIKSECPPEGFVLGSLHQHPNKGKKLSQEICIKFSVARKGKPIGKKWWNNGEICKFCHQQPGPEWVRGRLNCEWNKTRIIAKHKCRCIEKNLNFNGIKEAAIWLKIENELINTVRYKINACCSGKYKTAYGYHWEYVE